MQFFRAIRAGAEHGGRKCILREPTGKFPSATRGAVVLLNALDVNWSAQMSEVRVTGSLFYAELHKARSDRGGTVPAALHAINIPSEFSLSRIGYGCVQFDSQPEIVHGAAVAVHRPSADIFEEDLIKTSVEAMSFSRIDAPRFVASTSPRTADLLTRNRNPRFSNSSQRGPKSCQ